MEISPAASDLRSREEAAERLRITTRTLDQLTKEGRGPAATRVGGRVFYRDAEIERYLARQTGGAQGERMLSEKAEALATFD